MWTLLADVLFAAGQAGALAFLVYGGWLSLTAWREIPPLPRGAPSRGRAWA